MAVFAVIHTPFHHVPTAGPALAAAATTLESGGHRVAVIDAAALTFASWVDAMTTSARDKDAARRAWQRLSTDAFLDPVQAALDLSAMDFVLADVSRRYAPLIVDRHGMRHPQMTGADDLVRLAGDPAANPFHAAISGPVADALPKDVDMILVTVPAAGHALGAATAITMVRDRLPHVDVACMGRPDLLSLVGLPAADAEASGPAARAAKAWRSQFDIDRAVPEVPGLWPAGATAPPVARCALDPDTMPEAISAAVAGGIRVVEWTFSGSQPETVFRHLYQAAKAELWNHLVLPATGRGESDDALAAFAEANANIVHSWCRREPALSPFCDSLVHWPDGSPAYGDTAPMPGIPFWQVLRSPTAIARHVTGTGVNALSRMRWMAAEARCFEVGTGVRYDYLTPDRLSGADLDEIVRMVAAGGSVNTTFVRHNLERAFLIAVATEQGVIVGDSSLKHPRDEYIEAVSAQSGIDLHHYLERGYTSVRPEYRGQGIGAALLEGLTARAGDRKIFSIIAEGNTATQKMAIRNRTRRVATFFSQRAGKTVSVWIPEWMIPEGIDLPPQPDLT